MPSPVLPRVLRIVYATDGEDAVSGIGGDVSATGNVMGTTPVPWLPGQAFPTPAREER